MKRSSEGDIQPSSPIPSLKKKKLDQESDQPNDSDVNSLKILVSEYDPFVLGHIFKFCSPNDLPSLSLVNKEWHDLYFSIEKIGIILKEWVDARWNRILSGKLTWSWSVQEGKPSSEHDEFAFWVRLLNVLSIEKQLNIEMITDENAENELVVDDAMEQDDEQEDEEDEEDKQDEEDGENEDNNGDDEDDEDEEDEEEEDDKKDKKDKKVIQMNRESISAGVEFIEMEDTKLCKIETSPNRFVIVSNNGNVICFKRKKHNLLCLFYGGLTYPSFDSCNYRSDFWIDLVRNDRGIFILQLQQIVEYLGLDMHNHSIACHIIDIIGLKVKVSSSNYLDYPWDEGEAAGKIGFVPWEIVKACTWDRYDVSYMCSSVEPEDICSGLDQRFFNSFKLFVKLIELFISLDDSKSLYDQISDKVDQEFLKNRELLKCCRNNRDFFKILDETLIYDKDVIEEALKMNPNILKYILKDNKYHDIIKVDRELILDCLKRGFKISEIRGFEIDEEMIYASIKGGARIEDIPEPFKNSKDVIIAILKKDPYITLRQVSKFLSENKEIAFEVMKYSPRSWVPLTFCKDHPEILEQGVKTWYDFDAIGVDDEMAKNSLLELLKRSGKKLKVSFTYNGRKESKVIEISEKKLQPIFIIRIYKILHTSNSSSYSYTLRQLFGPHIDEKGYNAKLSITLEPKDNQNMETLKDEILAAILDYISDSWDRDISTKFRTTVKNFLEEE